MVPRLRRRNGVQHRRPAEQLLPVVRQRHLQRHDPPRPPAGGGGRLHAEAGRAVHLCGTASIHSAVVHLSGLRGYRAVLRGAVGRRRAVPH